MKGVGPIFAVFATIAVIATAGCAGNQGAAAAPAPAAADGQPKPTPEGKKNVAINRWLKDIDVEVPPAVYRVEPPDAIRITAPSVKELDKLEARLRPDGKVTLNLVGEVYIAGMSPAEIAQELSKRLERFYQKDSIYVTVEVTQFESKKYYVFGQVYASGIKKYTGSDTVVKVLAEAGLNDDAWPQKVVLIRPHEDPGVKQKVTIDVKQMYETGKADQNYVLEEGDLIYVPPSPLAEFKLKTERLLAPIMPVADFALMATTGFP